MYGVVKKRAYAINVLIGRVGVKFAIEFEA
jgi:hypothetical protein